MAGALALLASGCASIEAPPAPAVGSLAPAAAPQTTGGGPVSAERKRLIDAFGGEYSAPATERYLNEILARLAPASQTPSEPYRVTILDSPVVNAFALPSGDIFVTRGLLALANDGSEVAAVMAHEIAHVTAHHAAQRAELEKTAALFTRVSAQVLDRPQEGEEVQARMKLSIAHFSRQQEFEADKIGIGVIAKAGYDPYAASRFLTSLGRWSALRASLIGLGSADKPDMMATHPSTPERVAQAIAEARQVGAPGIGETARDAYLSAIDGIAYGDDPGQGLVRGDRFLHPKLGFAFAAPEGFTLENQAAALIGVGEGGAQALRLDSIELSESTTLESALASGWIDGVKTGSIETISGGDLPMATAVAQGEQWSFRLGAVRLGGRVFRLIFAAHSLTPAVDARFLAAIRSFHRLKPEEAAEARELHLQIVAAQPDDAAETLARRMPFEERALAQFLVLNGFERAAPLAAGQRYKVVAP
ncbi:MAG TPA: M48 family metalloprotease [Roseiarcus sp.]|nr:M48 family metalloprotease [Roseiarcus sp.]